MPAVLGAITGELAVNTITAGDQAQPTVATLEDGGYVVVWTDHSAHYIYGQRYDGAGNKIGGQFQVSTTATNLHSSPEVVGLDGGGFAVVWTTYFVAGSNSHGDITMRVFDSATLPTGNPFVVHAASATNQDQASITQLSNGGLVITWSSYNSDQSDIEIWGRRYTAVGEPLGNEFLLSSNTDNVQSSAVAAALAGGGFVVTWQNTVSGGAYDVFARLFDANGIGGTQFPVNTTTFSHQMRPSAVGLVDGSFVIAWNSFGQDGDGFGVYGQRFDSGGNRIGEEFVVPNATAGDQFDPQITALRSGGFVIAWVSSGTDGSGTGIYGRLFDGRGQTIGEQFIVNASTSGDQADADLASLADGRFAIAWQSAGQDGDANGIYARIFATPVQHFALNNDTGDFNGDGRDDILWRSEGGALSNWLANANGGFAANDGNAFTHVPNSWHIIGSGDFNGDGRDDILWRGPAGELSNWLGTASGGFTINDVHGRYELSADWHVVGIGEFISSDGRDDLLLRKTTGEIMVLMGTVIGGFVVPSGTGTTNVATNWHIVGVGDFNGDNLDDILWRSETGALSNWLATNSGGFSVNDQNAFRQVPTDWNVVGTGDFNGDGRDDILWRSDGGLLSNWLANANGGYTVNDANALVGVPVSWHVAGVGDFNGDGRDDILWRNETGALSNWLANANGGFSPNDDDALSQVPTDWHVQSPDPLWL